MSTLPAGKSCTDFFMGIQDFWYAASTDHWMDVGTPRDSLFVRGWGAIPIR